MSARRSGLVARCFLLGTAAGCRSSMGLLGAALARGGGRLRMTAAAATAGELVADKLPMAPPRTEPAGLAARFGGAAVGASALAARSGSTIGLPVAAAVAGAWVGANAGLAWRTASARRRPDWQGALVEDAVALGLAVAVSRR